MCFVVLLALLLLLRVVLVVLLCYVVVCDSVSVACLWFLLYLCALCLFLHVGIFSLSAIVSPNEIIVIPTNK